MTVSAVPDEQSPEVGGLQNTATNLGASIGTALAGSLLIAVLTTSFLHGIEQNPAVPPAVSAQANVKLAGGIPFLSEADLQTALTKAGASKEVTQAVVDENEKARLDGLRTAPAALALIALLGLFFSTRLPTEQPGSAEARRSEHAPRHRNGSGGTGMSGMVATSYPSSLVRMTGTRARQSPVRRTAGAPTPR